LRARILQISGHSLSQSSCHLCFSQPFFG
jgi:hypothetical protein